MFANCRQMRPSVLAVASGVRPVSEVPHGNTGKSATHCRLVTIRSPPDTDLGVITAPQFVARAVTGDCAQRCHAHV
jgi:hypothetical protein